MSSRDSGDEHHCLHSPGFLETDLEPRARQSHLQKASAPGEKHGSFLLFCILIVVQVWWGTGLGLIICVCIGVGLIAAFYTIGNNYFSGTEDVWEGSFGLFAAIVITFMGAALLRVSKLQDKWRMKLAKALESKESTKQGGKWGRFKRWGEKYAMFTLPFITVLREGLEAIIFIGGIGLAFPATAFPLPVFLGLFCGCLIGYCIYK